MSKEILIQHFDDESLVTIEAIDDDAIQILRKLDAQHIADARYRLPVEKLLLFWAQRFNLSIKEKPRITDAQRAARSQNMKRAISGRWGPGDHKRDPNKYIEYRTWSNMLHRCQNPQNKEYHNYGGRGIKVCERWLTFENFYADMGARPGPEYSIDRIEVNGNYEPENCRWATKEVQAKNKRKTYRTQE